MQHEPEVVKIIDAHRLIDSESYERSYRTGGTLNLVPGYYIVWWPNDSHLVDYDYDEDAEFVGPYDRYETARLDIERVKQTSGSRWGARPDLPA